MAKRSVPISDQLRAAIRDCGRTIYRVSKDCGIAESQLHNFVNGKCGVGLQNLDTLCDYVGLELRPAKRPPKKRKKA